ncbi:phospholipase A1 member A [Anabrus simplex]|uniref:phospholipase A1 member A n=1 Tax=Anabrus simplex TaxID=316456 RepID=UPI0035A3121D
MLTVRSCSLSSKSVANRQISQVMLRFYTGKTVDEFYTVPLNQSMKIVQHEYFNKSRCIVVYIFGYETRPRDAATVQVINAYLQANKYNLVLVDWSAITANNAYNVAVSLMVAIAPDIAKSIDTMLDSGVELCHLAGHSLGAQCTGAVARSMRHRVHHIIALDPAGPLFYLPLKCARALSKDDADCVEAVRTDAGGLGAPPVVSVGKVDYYVNGGVRSQPNCTDDRVPNQNSPNVETGCSHNRALSIMAGAIRNFVGLIAVRCSSWPEFLTGTCRHNTLMAIGNCSSSSQPGTYFLRTNSTQP